MQSPQYILNNLKEDLSKRKELDINKNHEKSEEKRRRLQSKNNYKICFEATQEFSNQYDGIRKFATLWEFQARLTTKIWVKDDMRWASKQEQDKQLRKL